MKQRAPAKYPPEEVEYLLTIVNSKDISTIPEKYKWIRSLKPLEARDELLMRFQSIIASLVEVCLKGKFWSSYSKTFLRLFSAKGTPLQNVATSLRKELVTYTRDELYHVGRISVLLAIERCESNLASTIVYCFKDEITKLINKEAKTYQIYSLLEDYQDIATIDHQEMEDNAAFNCFLSELNEEEWLSANALISGEQVDIPASLKEKFKQYLETTSI